MWKVGAPLAFALALGLITLIPARSHHVQGQEDPETSAEATIAALETEVAQLETTVAEIQPPQLEPTPTVVPFTGEPVASSNGIEVLYYYFVDNAFQDQYPELLGELRNSTDTTMSVGILAVSIVLLDDQGNIVDEIPCEVADTIIPPHDTVPFIGSWINSDNKPDIGDWTMEQVTINVVGPVDTADDLVVKDVTELSLTASYFAVSGWVGNLRDVPTSDFITLIAAGYDSEGRFVGFVYGQISAPIPAGKKAQFTIASFTDPAFEGLVLSPDPNLYTYRIFVRE